MPSDVEEAEAGMGQASALGGPATDDADDFELPPDVLSSVGWGWA